MFRAVVHQQRHLAQPPHTLTPHVTFDCDSIGTPDLARPPLQYTGGSSLPASAGIIITPVYISWLVVLRDPLVGYTGRKQASQRTR